MVSIDPAELFISVFVADDNEDAEEGAGWNLRYAFAPAYDDDSIMLSPHWDETRNARMRTTVMHGSQTLIFRTAITG